MKKLLILIVSVVTLFTLVACNVTSPDSTTGNDENLTTPDSKEDEATHPQTSEPESDEVENEELSYGSTFVFDDLEITIGNAEDVTLAKVDNQFSDNNGADVIVLPVTIKNLKDESHSLNMFYYNFYGSAGTEIDSVSSYFHDSDIEFAGHIRSGASLTSAFHILYDGDGDYYIEFSDLFSEKIEIKLPIAK